MVLGQIQGPHQATQVGKQVWRFGQSIEVALLQSLELGNSEVGASTELFQGQTSGLSRGPQQCTEVVQWIRL